MTADTHVSARPSPGHHRSITQDCRKCLLQDLDLQHISQLILYRTAVATIVGTTPGDHRSIAPDSANASPEACIRYTVFSCSRTQLLSPPQKAPPQVTTDSKCIVTGLDLLPISQLMLYRTAVATRIGITPGDHRSITQDCSQCLFRSLYPLHIFQCLPNTTAIASMQGTAPCDHRSITQDCGKRKTRSLDVLHVLHPVLYGFTVATKVSETLGDHGSITQYCSECTVRSLDDLLHMLQLRLYRAAAPTEALITPSDHNHRSITPGSAAHLAADPAPHCCRHHHTVVGTTPR